MAFWKAILVEYENMVNLGIYDDSHMSYNPKTGTTGASHARSTLNDLTIIGGLKHLFSVSVISFDLVKRSQEPKNWDDDLPFM